MTMDNIQDIPLIPATSRNPITFAYEGQFSSHEDNPSSPLCQKCLGQTPGAFPLFPCEWASTDLSSPSVEPSLSYIDPLASVNTSLQELVDLSPCLSHCESASLSPLTEPRHFEWAPVTHPEAPPRQTKRQNSNSSESSSQKSQESIEKRRLQNRRAQQAYRQRREELVNRLRGQIATINHQQAASMQEREQLAKHLKQLQEENSKLRSWIQSSIMGNDNGFTFSQPWKPEKD